MLFMCPSESGALQSLVAFPTSASSLLSRKRTTLKRKKQGTRAVEGTLFPLGVQEICSLLRPQG